MKHPYATAALAALMVSSIAACDSNPSGPGSTTDAPFTVTMQSQSANGGSAMLRLMANGRVALANVESITLPIGDVEARTAAGEWVSAGTVDESIDLFGLPADGVVLLDSSLPEGSYDALRFYLSGDPTITLAEDVTVGRTTYAAGTHTLVIPSADQNGIRLAASFDVGPEGQDLTVLFDGDQTVNHVTATGSGKIMIAPVLEVRNQEGEDVGGIDEGEGEGAVQFADSVASTIENGLTLADGTVVLIDEDTRIEGDILSLAAVADALASGEGVYAEGVGSYDTDGASIIASTIELEAENEPDHLGGSVGEVNLEAGTFTVVNDSETTTVVIADDTELSFEDGLADLQGVIDAIGSGTTVYVDAEGAFQSDGTFAASEVTFNTSAASD